MKINKISSNKNTSLKNEYFYKSARDGMYDLLNNMYKEGFVNKLFLPGYIGWSPKEGSGIFDPINKIEGLEIEYYKMTSELNINHGDLVERIAKVENQNFAVLIVNYFGFVDTDIHKISGTIKEYSGWIIEDNAHGYFTYQNSNEVFSDATFFSLHKMFPFQGGGSLVLTNKKLKEFKYFGETLLETSINPYLYDINEIANKRLENYLFLDEILKNKDIGEYISPLKKELQNGIIPQTYPIVINKGNRDEIYKLMNDAGYGVVSLYHTLIEPLRSSEYSESYKLSKVIMNLPVHQDVDNKQYSEMIKLLLKYCKTTNI